MITLRSAVALLLASALFALSSCGAGTNNGSQSSDKTVQTVAVSPNVTIPIPAGLTQQLSASAYYSDGTGAEVTSGATWSSDDETVATVDSTGLVTAVAAGTAVVQASFAGFQSSGIEIVVTSATLDFISLEATVGSLAAGLTTTLTVWGHYSDGSSSQLTSDVTYDSSVPAKATVSVAGLVLGVAAGTTDVTAHYGAFDSDPVTITVSSAVLQSITLQAGVGSIALGLTTQLSVLGNYSDGTSVTLSSGVTFSSLTTGLASISSGGLVTALGTGAATLHASYGAFTDDVDVSVTSAILQSLSLQPGLDPLIAGLTRQVSVLGNYSDGTSIAITSGVTFSSGNLGLATVNSSGVVTGIGAGTVSIGASYGGKSTSANVSVTAAVLDFLTLGAGSNSIIAGLTTPLTVYAVFTDGSSTQLTSGVAFSVSNSAFATVSSLGVVTGIGTGTVTVTASYGGESVTTDIAVATPSLTSISLGIGNGSLAAGLTTQLTVTAHYDNATDVVLGTGVTFSVDGVGLGKVSVSGSGLVSALAATTGAATITASYGGQSDTASLSVTSALLQSVTVGFTGGNVVLGLTKQLTVTGHYSDASTATLSAGVTYSVSSAALASVTSGGLLTGLGVGSPTVTATYAGVSSSPVTVTVENPTLVSIEVTSPVASIAIGHSVQMTVTATYNNGATANVTSQATYSSNALISISLGGLVVAISIGDPVVTATYGGMTDTVSIHLTLL